MDHQPLFHRAAIIGVGVVGGSLGMALRRKHLCQCVIGIDLSTESLQEAIRIGAVDEATPDLATGVANADLVILATPIDVCLKLLPILGTMLSSGVVLIDVASTKSMICAQAEHVLPTGIMFIGGHPMAGSEKSGIAGADPFLFQDAPYILTPTTLSSPESIERVSTLVESIGAQCIIMDPNQHDQTVAAISHLPHVVASMLVNAVAEFAESSLSLAGRGFADATRIAGGSPTLWRSILATNGPQVRASLTYMRQAITELEAIMSTEQWDLLEERLESAKTTRRQLARRSGTRSILAELVVIVQDQPGSIGRICTILGNAQINIADLELLRVEEGEGGTFRLGFSLQTEAHQAQTILTSMGYTILAS